MKTAVRFVLSPIVAAVIAALPVASFAQSAEFPPPITAPVSAPTTAPTTAPVTPVTQSTAPVAKASSMDPALQAMFAGLAMSLITQMTVSMASGQGLDGFDPGPMLEKTLKNALSSRELNALIGRLMDQMGSGADGATSLSPEMRAVLKAALTAGLTLARTEITRELNAK